MGIAGAQTQVSKMCLRGKSERRLQGGREVLCSHTPQAAGRKPQARHLCSFSDTVPLCGVSVLPLVQTSEHCHTAETSSEDMACECNVLGECDAMQELP
jgi:hypothetical protein